MNLGDEVEEGAGLLVLWAIGPQLQSLRDVIESGFMNN